MEYFKIRNCDTFQQYKDRSPSWIKLYRTLLTDYEYRELPDADKSHLIGIFLRISKRKHFLPERLHPVF